MKRLLLIAQLFPPEPSPGALRPGYLARYLPQFGWEVTTITETADTPPFAARVIHASGPMALQQRIRSRITARIENPYSPLRVAIRNVKQMLFFPDPTAPWMLPALRAGSQLLKKEKFDVILSTAHPASAHVIAWILASRYGLPWVADYRDPWAGNAYVHRGPLRTLLERLLERSMLRRAATITTVSQGFARMISAFHNRSDIRVIPNAYDASDWSAIPAAEPQSFELCFTGSMYDGKRNPEIFFQALSELHAEQHPAAHAAQIRFYGRNLDNVKPAASRAGIDSIVHVNGVVPRTQAMLAQRASAGLLLFLNMDPATSHEMGSKYLEYIGARRPILAFGPSDSVMREFIAQHDLGWFASSVPEAKNAIVGVYTRFINGTWETPVDARGIPSAPELAGAFASVLDAAVDSANN
jgi:glycosyltransferase involved in cell wall biosynthesis